MARGFLETGIAFGRPVNWSHPVAGSLHRLGLVVPGRTGSRLLDLSGRSHGSLTSGPGWVGNQGRPGGWGAISLDGTDDWITAGYVAAHNLTASFSVAAWAYSRATS